MKNLWQDYLQINTRPFVRAQKNMAFKKVKEKKEKKEKRELDQKA